MKYILVLLIMVTSIIWGCDSTPTENKSSKTLADIAGAAVVMKHSMAQNAEIKTEDRWRFIAFSVSEQLKSLGFNDGQIERFAKEIVSRGPYPSMEEEVLAAREHYGSITDPNQF